MISEDQTSACDIPPEFRLSSYQFELPEELIAQEPVAVRDQSRLMVINRADGSINHLLFRDLPDLLNRSDVLAINQTGVVPALIRGRKKTGGSVELLALNPATRMIQASEEHFAVRECLVKTSKRLKPGASILLDDNATLSVKDCTGPGRAIIIFPCKEHELHVFLQTHGNPPLPPYIKASANPGIEHRLRYQTVYSTTPGSIAAPTAGLHFSEELISSIQNMGVQIIRITLHVGIGTFMPMRSEDIRNHRMESEFFHISEEAASSLNTAIKTGRRIVAVGSTSMRTLESATTNNNIVTYGPQHTELFIKPGYEFRVCGGMITNFHLPNSTLLALVASFAGMSTIRKAYAEAIKHRYRFFSYGDSSIII